MLRLHSCDPFDTFVEEFTLCLWACSVQDTTIVQQMWGHTRLSYYILILLGNAHAICDGIFQLLNECSGT